MCRMCLLLLSCQCGLSQGPEVKEPECCCCWYEKKYRDMSKEESVACVIKIAKMNKVWDKVRFDDVC